MHDRLESELEQRRGPLRIGPVDSLRDELSWGAKVKERPKSCERVRWGSRISTRIMASLTQDGESAAVRCQGRAGDHRRGAHRPGTSVVSDGPGGDACTAVRSFWP